MTRSEVTASILGTVTGAPRIGEPNLAAEAYAIHWGKLYDPDWQDIGSGSTRRAYRYKDQGVVYKVNKYPDPGYDHNVNEFRRAELLYPDFPKNIPPVTLYGVSGDTVVAMPYYEKGCGCQYNDLRELSLATDIEDVGQHNVRRDDNDNYVIIDMGEYMGGWESD